MLYPIPYEFLFLFTSLADPEPGAEAKTSIFQLQLHPGPTAITWLQGQLHAIGWLPGPTAVTWLQDQLHAIDWLPGPAAITWLQGFFFSFICLLSFHKL